MKKIDPQFHDLRDRLLQSAALRDAFDPRALLDEIVPPSEAGNVLLRAHLMSALREASVDLHPSRQKDTGGDWSLRPIQRRKALAEVTLNEDAASGDIVRAIKGEGEFADDALAGAVTDPPGIATLEHWVETLSRAGPAAPGHRHVMALGATLNRMRKDALTDDILKGGFVGREGEIEKVEAVLASPHTQPPLQTLHIEGIPGIGKSFLLEQILKICRGFPDIITIRLDFDRASLRGGATEAVFEETSRQIGDALPEHAEELRRMRTDFARRQTELRQSSSDMRVPYEMLNAMVKILQSRNRRLLFQLDTLEVLQGHGATFVERLMDDLDRFAETGKIAISVISAGRGPIFTRGNPRLRDLIHLDTLDEEITELILAGRGLPEHLWPKVIELSGGNPLRVILAARAIEEAEGLDLPDSANIDTAFLYRAILSRVPAEIREVATEGLILPVLDQDMLIHVVSPALGIPTDDDHALDLLTQLAEQDWLVTGSVETGLSHRPSARAEFLELTYRERAEACAAINLEASRYWAATNPAQALYHTLQRTRAGAPMPEIDPSVAQRLPEALLDELPPDARDAVLQARGERSRTRDEKEAAPARTDMSAARRPRRALQKKQPFALTANPNGTAGGLWLLETETPSRSPSERDLTDLRVMLENGETREAEAVFQQQFNSAFPLESEAGLLAFALQWRGGRWSMARTLLDQYTDGTLAEALSRDPVLTGRSLLEAWAEFRPDKLVELLRNDASLRSHVHEAQAMSGRVGLRGGALEFVLLGLVGADAPSLENAVSVTAPHMPDVPETAAVDLQNRAEAYRNEFGLFFSLGQSGDGLSDADFAQSVGPVNPYAEPIRAYITTLEAGAQAKVLTDLQAIRPDLARLAVNFAPHVGGVETALEKVNQRPGDVLELMIAMGLLVEWARGTTFFSPVPELPTLAAAAERWQQTAGGFWRYGAHRPANWTSHRQVDALAEARVWRLLNAPDPTSAALEALRTWDLPEQGGAPPPILHRRLSGIYDALLRVEPVGARLSYLQDSGVAGVLQAPLVVLAMQMTPRKMIFGS
jgi:hypothetical protein